MTEQDHMYEPDYVSPPGGTLLDLLEEKDMSQSELAQRMGRPLKTINEIIHAKKALTPETALQLEKVFGTPARFWLKREQNYREHLARQAENEALQQHQDWVENFPTQEMQKKGWLPATTDNFQLLLTLLQFFGIAHPENWTYLWSDCLIDYRKSPVFKSDDYALSAWLRQGEREAGEVFCQPYHEAQFEQYLQHEIRALTLIEDLHHIQKKLQQLCAQVGVAVILVPQIDQARVNGATRWLSKNKALIQLSLRHKKNDVFWFTFFHEAAHILLHGKRDMFIDLDDETNIEKETKEIEANNFAMNTLVPIAAYQRFLKTITPPYISKNDVTTFAQSIQIHPGIVVGRLQYDNHLPKKNLNGLRLKFDWASLVQSET